MKSETKSQAEKDVSIWIPIYIGEILSMTTRLTTEQFGGLCHLMLDYWKNGAIPDDNKIIGAITHLPPNKAKLLKESVLATGIFAKDDELNIIYSHYLDGKKDEATENRKAKSERAKKAAEARWGKETQEMQTHDVSNANEMLEHNTSNANNMLMQCPLPLSSPLSLSSSNNSLSHSQAGETKNEKKQAEIMTSIQHWQAPTLDEMRSRLLNVGFVGVLNQETYDHCLNKFKTYWQNQEMQGNFLVTDDIRLQKLTDWVKQERPSREYRITDTGNSGKTSQPTTPAQPTPKLDPNNSAWAGDRFVELLPKMSKQQTEYFLQTQARGNQLSMAEVHEKISKNTDYWQKFDYEKFNKNFNATQQAVA